MATFYQDHGTRLGLLRQSQRVLNDITALARRARSVSRAMIRGGETYANVNDAVQDILDEAEDLVANLAATLAKVNWTYAQEFSPRPRELNFLSDDFNVDVDFGGGGATRIATSDTTFASLAAGDLLEIHNAKYPANNRDKDTTPQYVEVDAVNGGGTSIDLVEDLTTETSHDYTMTLKLVGH